MVFADARLHNLTGSIFFKSTVSIAMRAGKALKRLIGKKVSSPAYVQARNKSRNRLGFLPQPALERVSRGRE